MKKLLLTSAIMLAATPTFAKEITIKEVTDANTGAVYFSPDELTVQPGDTVTFENAQDDMHEVMFVRVPKGVDEMIMSPMHEKKGDKFSYIFTVPGTYNFHCHPHEAAGMKGTLIVGTSSKADEIKSMDHHKLSQMLEKGETAGGVNTLAASQAVASGGFTATGSIVSVNTAKHSIKIKHAPIKSLGWPAMTMSFTANSDVDLSSYKEGDGVTFTLKPAGKDDYTISSMTKN
jgi:plastocyanin